MKSIYIVVLLIPMFNACHPNSDIQDNTEKILIVDSVQPQSLNNPALMYGTDILNLLKRFSINQDYNSMLSFTSNKSKIHFGESSIIKFYKTPDLLGFDVTLKSVNYSADSSFCFLNYVAIIYATKKIKTIQCIVENDSAKLYLESLKDLFQHE